MKNWIDWNDNFKNKSGALYKALLDNWVLPETITREKIGYGGKRIKYEVPVNWDNIK